jgi:hypothetical protein
MATVTETKSVQSIASVGSQAMKIDGTDPVYNDWRDDLIRDGFAVIKGAIPQQRVEKYAEQMYNLLESL